MLLLLPSNGTEWCGWAGVPISLSILAEEKVSVEKQLRSASAPTLQRWRGRKRDASDKKNCKNAVLILFTTTIDGTHFFPHHFTAILWWDTFHFHPIMYLIAWYLIRCDEINWSMLWSLYVCLLWIRGSVHSSVRVIMSIHPAIQNRKLTLSLEEDFQTDLRRGSPNRCQCQTVSQRVMLPQQYEILWLFFHFCITNRTTAERTATTQFKTRDLSFERKGMYFC